MHNKMCIFPTNTYHKVYDKQFTSHLHKLRYSSAYKYNYQLSHSSAKFMAKIFSLMNSKWSSLSGRSEALFLGRAIPAREKSLSTSVEVGGGIRNLNSIRSNIHFKIC